MSRPIKLTNEVKENLFRVLEEKGPALLCNTDSIEIDNHEKITVYFKPEAFIKMQILTQRKQTEIGWHGLVSRTEGGFVVEDIVVYPQTGQKNTIRTNEVELNRWQCEQPDNNKLRLHGHSHAMNSANPSRKDKDDREIIINGLLNLKMEEMDLFYIFLICNKKGEMQAVVYDIKNNRYFQEDDVIVDFVDENGDKAHYANFWREANQLCRE